MFHNIDLYDIEQRRDTQKTIEGVIHPINVNGMTLIVALQTYEDNLGGKHLVKHGSANLTVPERINGRLVYALPGGGRYQP